MPSSHISDYDYRWNIFKTGSLNMTFTRTNEMSTRGSSSSQCWMTKAGALFSILEMRGSPHTLSTTNDAVAAATR
jgi:hypothetical protein